MFLRIYFLTYFANGTIQTKNAFAVRSLSTEFTFQYGIIQTRQEQIREKKGESSFTFQYGTIQSELLYSSAAFRTSFTFQSGMIQTKRCYMHCYKK